MNRFALATFFALLTLANNCQAAAPTDQQPNVILILADDLGPGMIGCYGQQRIKTPHIDQLAAEGMKFNNYYGGVYCAPARWTLLTGMHDGRNGGWGQTRAGLLINLDKKNTPSQESTQALNRFVEKNSAPIPDNEVFLAQIAKRAGYQTAQFGKLDVGFLTNSDRVKRFGWDFHEGYYSHQRCHGFYPPYLWRNGERFPLEGNLRADCGKMSEKGDEPVGAGGKTYSQNVFIEGILKYIRTHKDKPFFLYHPTQLPHGPVAIPELHPDFADDASLSLAEKKYASMVKMLDDHVGLILAELKTQGIDKNTVVVFASDNGHELYYGPKPSYQKQRLPDGQKANLTDRKWRTSECGDVFDGAGGRAGLKRSGYQGGMQCPMIVRWPDHIPAGSQNNLLTTHYDFMATLADLTGQTLPDGKDSISYLPTLLGKPQPEQHEFVVVRNKFRSMGSSALICNDGWKLVESDQKNGKFQLYNINVDNQERYNLEKQYPARVAELKKIFHSQMQARRPDL